MWVGLRGLTLACRRTLMFAIGLLAALLFSACDSNHSSPDNMSDMAMENADPSIGNGAHQPLPQMPNQGGPTIVTPEVWVVYWPGDETLADSAGKFLTWLTSSDHWSTALGEYGIQPGIFK